jgi:hypothetical protein
MAEVNLAHAQVHSWGATHDQISSKQKSDGVQIASSKVVEVSIASLRPGESPRLEGEDKAHVAWLTETQAPLPPILVDRRTMRVIDGMHRLLAASLKGRATIEVEFFDGSPADGFVRGVEANVTHGLPLSQADRRAAAARIVASHPQMSDRAIGEVAGLAARSVAGIRRRSTGGVPQLNARVGRDGRVRPLDGVAGRRRAAELLAKHPRASLRQVARAAGVSPATVSDVRHRLERGEEPVPEGRRRAPGRARHGGAVRVAGRDSRHPAVAGGGSPGLVLEKLLRDPSLRHNEQGRRLLFLLQNNAVRAEEWSVIAGSVPSHCLVLVAQLAQQYAQMWSDFKQELDERARVIGPWDRRPADSRV